MKPQDTKAMVLENSRKNVISFIYTNKSGEKSVKKVEPYDPKDEFMFYGFDLEENKTKLFSYANMRAVVVEGSFVPRFEKKEV